MPLNQGTRLTIISGAHKGHRGYLHAHVHQTPTDWPQVLHHYYRITLVDEEGADPVQPGHLYGPAVLTADENLSRAVNVFIGKAGFRWRSNDGSG